MIVGDWGITEDAGGCANVKTAIDTLTTLINDVIAPTGSDYNIAADRLYFNEVIAQECTGLTRNEFSYSLNDIEYCILVY